MVRAEHGLDVLGIHRLGLRRETDEVAEENGDDLAVTPEGWSGLLGQGRCTERAKRELARELLAASGAVRHTPSVGAREAEITVCSTCRRYSETAVCELGM